MKRGEIWAYQDKAYGAKPRPAIIMQAKDLEDYDTIMVCPLTSHETYPSNLRETIKPSKQNGLHDVSFAMTDKLTPLKREHFGYKIGELNESDMTRLSKKVTNFLGLK